MKLLCLLLVLRAVFTSVLAAPTSISKLKAKLYSTGISDQLIDGTPCRDITVIYARGTTQKGNIGNSQAVGPITFDALASIVGQQNLAVQGVDYDASFLGYALGGNPKATGEMAFLVQTALKKCPYTKTVLLGYSQGAQVVHNAVGILSPIEAKALTAIITYGDPYAQEAVPPATYNKWHIVCHRFDELCKGKKITVTPDHLNYQKDAVAVAKWIAAKVGYGSSQVPNNRGLRAGFVL